MKKSSTVSDGSPIESHTLTLKDGPKRKMITPLQVIGTAALFAVFVAASVIETRDFGTTYVTATCVPAVLPDTGVDVTYTVVYDLARPVDLREIHLFKDDCSRNVQNSDVEGCIVSNVNQGSGNNCNTQINALGRAADQFRVNLRSTQNSDDDDDGGGPFGGCPLPYTFTINYPDAFGCADDLYLMGDRSGGSAICEEGDPPNDLVPSPSCSPDFCSDDSDCDDSDECTNDMCSGMPKRCTSVFDVEEGPDCCAFDTDCDDGDPCTTDTCNGSTMRCMYAPINDCCADDADCPDPDVCTSSTCNLLLNTCDEAPVPGCCLADHDCSDSDSCTLDKCEANSCTNTAVPNCCVLDVECDDSDACTTDICEQGPFLFDICVNAFTPGAGLTGDCCQTDYDCDDSDACTLDTCEPEAVAGQGKRCLSTPLVSFPDGAGGICCLVDGDCNDGLVCTDDTCGLDGRCDFTPWAGCCSTVDDCDDSDPCTTDICDSGSGECQNAYVASCCQVDADCNDNNFCTDDTCGGDGWCDFTPIDDGDPCCTASSQCDDSDPCTTDSCNLALSICENTPIVGCCTLDSQCDDWNPCTTGSCDLGSNTCSQIPVADCCTSSAECDDSDVCTLDICAANECASLPPLPGCCNIDDDCPAPPPYFTVFCNPSNECEFEVRPDFCFNDHDCEDGDSCTINECDEATFTCLPPPPVDPLCCRMDGDCTSSGDCLKAYCSPFTNECSEYPVHGCCETAADCDDMLFCTGDFCIANVCTYAPPSPTCCESDDPQPCLALGPCYECVSHACTAFAGVGFGGAECCLVDADCDDSDPCTTEACQSDGVCVRLDIDTPDCGGGGPATCTVTADCPGVPCQVAACDTNTSTCLYIDDPACCIADGDCDDNNACTTDTCEPDPSVPSPYGICQNALPPPGSETVCCTMTEECDDSDPCTVEGCIDGACARGVVDLCCNQDSDCATPIIVDGCRRNRCESLSNVCVLEDVDGCCATDEDCVDGDGCTLDLCIAKAGFFSKCYNGPADFNATMDFEPIVPGDPVQSFSFDLCSELEDPFSGLVAPPDSWSAVASACQPNYDLPLPDGPAGPGTKDFNITLVTGGTQEIMLACLGPEDCSVGEQCLRDPPLVSCQDPLTSPYSCAPPDDEAVLMAEGISYVFTYADHFGDCRVLPRPGNMGSLIAGGFVAGSLELARNDTSLCCSTDTDCPVGPSACQPVRCDTNYGLCVQVPLLDGCCTGTGDVAAIDDGNICTADSCYNNNIINALTVPPECVALIEPTERNCYEATCDRTGNEGAGLCGSRWICGADPTQPCMEPVCQPSLEGGACVLIEKDCDDSDRCTVDSCSPVDGSCQHLPFVCGPDPDDLCETRECSTDPGLVLPNSEVTDPLDPLFFEQWCVAAGAIECDDSTDCTNDSCNPDNGMCVHTNACVAADPCMISRCVDGPGGEQCQVAPRICDDNSPCTLDLCVDETVQAAYPNTTLALGQCFFPPAPPCPAGNATHYGAWTGSMCEFLPYPVGSCNDFDLLTLDERDVEGECVSTPHTSPAACTNDADCTLSGGEPPASAAVCEYGFNGEDSYPSCGVLSYNIGPEPVEICSVDADCTTFPQYPHCSPTAGRCVPTGADCIDDRDCFSLRTACSEYECQTGVCTVVGRVCDTPPAAGLCEVAYCDAPGGGCMYMSTNCDDGLPCTYDMCDPLAGCIHVPLSPCCCNDSNDCTSSSACVSGICDASQQCVYDADFGCCQSDSVCDDGSSCTINRCDVESGLCEIEQVDCVDSFFCTIDICDPVQGCLHFNSFSCHPANGCQTATAVEGVDSCECLIEDVPTDDGNPCTADLCMVGASHEGECTFAVVEDPHGDPREWLKDIECDTNIPGLGSPTSDGGLEVSLFGAQSGVYQFVVGSRIQHRLRVCDDKSACTEDLCAMTSGESYIDPNGEVAFTVIGECYQPRRADVCCGDSECEDYNRCTEDHCVPLGGPPEPNRWDRIDPIIAGECSNTQIVDCCGPSCVGEGDVPTGPPGSIFTPCPAPSPGAPKSCQLALGSYGECLESADPCVECFCPDEADCESPEDYAVCNCVRIEGCCSSFDDPGCDDSNACTVDTCDVDSGQCCFHGVADPLCCNTDTDCIGIYDPLHPAFDDWISPGGCTSERCVLNQCRQLIREQCCELTPTLMLLPIGEPDFGCNDCDACTLDRCTDELLCPDPECDPGDKSWTHCVHDDIPNCCSEDSDCAPLEADRCHQAVCCQPPLGGDCTDPGPQPECCPDLAPGDSAVCAVDTIPGCCLDDCDCDDRDPCTTDSCCEEVGGCDGGSVDFATCLHVPIPNCCISSADCQTPPPPACSFAQCIRQEDGPDPCDTTPPPLGSPLDLPHGLCVTDALPGCCVDDADCAAQTGSACYECNGDSVCVRVDGCCDIDTDCPFLGDPCQGPSCCLDPLGCAPASGGAAVGENECYYEGLAAECCVPGEAGNTYCVDNLLGDCCGANGRCATGAAACAPPCTMLPVDAQDAFCRFELGFDVGDECIDVACDPVEGCQATELGSPGLPCCLGPEDCDDGLDCTDDICTLVGGGPSYPTCLNPRNQIIDSEDVDICGVCSGMPDDTERQCDYGFTPFLEDPGVVLEGDCLCTATVGYTVSPWVLALDPPRTGSVATNDPYDDLFWLTPTQPGLIVYAEPEDLLVDVSQLPDHLSYDVQVPFQITWRCAADCPVGGLCNSGDVASADRRPLRVIIASSFSAAQDTTCLDGWPSDGGVLSAPCGPYVDLVPLPSDGACAVVE